MPQIEYGDPERDDLAASEEELRDLQSHPGYQEIKRHFGERLERFKRQLTQRGIDQREADRLRGNIEVCETLLGIEHESSVLDMLIDLAEEQKQDGRRSGTNTDRRRGS